MLVSPVFWPLHLRQDEPPGWDGETIERSGHAPRDGPRALFFTCSCFTARLTACSESELPAELLNRGRAFPCSAPCLRRKPGLSSLTKPAPSELALGRGPRPGSTPGSWPRSP